MNEILARRFPIEASLSPSSSIYPRHLARLCLCLSLCLCPALKAHFELDVPILSADSSQSSARRALTFENNNTQKKTSDPLECLRVALLTPMAGRCRGKKSWRRLVNKPSGCRFTLAKPVCVCVCMCMCIALSGLPWVAFSNGKQINNNDKLIETRHAR